MAPGFMGKIGKFWNSNKDRNKENEDPFERDEESSQVSKRRSSRGQRPIRVTSHNCEDDFPEGNNPCYSNAVARQRQYPRGPLSLPAKMHMKNDNSPQNDQSFATEFEFSSQMAREQDRYGQRGDRRSMRNNRMPFERERQLEEEEESSYERLETFTKSLRSKVIRLERKVLHYKEELRRVRSLKDEVEQAFSEQLSTVRSERDYLREECRMLKSRLENVRHYQNLPIVPRGLQLGSGGGFRMPPDNTPSTSALESITGAGESLTTQSNCSFMEPYNAPPVPNLEPLFPVNPFMNTQLTIPTRVAPTVTPIASTSERKEETAFTRRSQSCSFHSGLMETPRGTNGPSHLNDSGRVHSEILLQEETHSNTSNMDTSNIETPRRKSLSLDLARPNTTKKVTFD